MQPDKPAPASLVGSVGLYRTPGKFYGLGLFGGVIRKTVRLLAEQIPQTDADCIALSRQPLAEALPDVLQPVHERCYRPIGRHLAVQQR